MASRKIWFDDDDDNDVTMTTTAACGGDDDIVTAMLPEVLHYDISREVVDARGRRVFPSDMIAMRADAKRPATFAAPLSDFEAAEAERARSSSPNGRPARLRVGQPIEDEKIASPRTPPPRWLLAAVMALP